MSTYVTTYTFAAGAKVKASEANANFSNISSFLNNNVVHVDGSKAFTAVPIGPATNPTVDNHLTRKKYVDDSVAAVSGLVGTGFTTSSTISSQLGTTNTNVTQRPTVWRQDTTATAPVLQTGLKIYTGTFVGTTDANGLLSFTYGTAFTTALTVLVSNGDMAIQMIPQVKNWSTTGWTVECRSIISVSYLGATALDLFKNTNVRINYIAIGV